MPRRPAAGALLLLCALAAGILGTPLSVRAQEPPAPPAPLVREILVQGSRMVEEATVRARIGSREGAAYDPEQVSRDLRAIFELGYFEDVKVEAEGFEGGLRLVYRLVDKPILREVEFEGNREAKAEDLREKAALVAHTSYNARAVAEALQRLRAFYREKGYYQALIRTRTEPAGEGQVTLFFVIEEGEKYRLVKIRFSGNRQFSDADLRGEIKSTAWWLLSPLTGSGRLQLEQLEEDRQRLVHYYQDHGYLEARIGEPEIAQDDKEHSLLVTLPVTEGLQYRLGTVSLSGDDLVPLPEIRRVLELQEGDVFRRSAFAQGISKITQRYTSRGYAFVKVDYSSRLDPERRTIDVTFLVDKGALARFGRVTISGNTMTRDKVVRRELDFAEGDLFDSDALRRSRQKVMNLGFFENVDLLPRPRADNTIDIDIQVKERLTGAISFGLGYSSEDKLSGQIQVTESNFFGWGQSVALMAQVSSTRRNYSLSFNEPAVLDTRYSLGFSVYDVSREFDDYHRHSRGGRITFGRSFFTYYRGFLALKDETVTVSDISSDASTYIKDQEGKANTRSLRLSFVRDARDNFFNPTTGSRSVIYTEYAGLGGDNEFVKYGGEASLYTPLFWKLVFMVHGQLDFVQGLGGKQPPIYEKFFVGGITTVRGFESRSIGPHDEKGEPIGGYKAAVVNTEIIVPLAPEQGFNLVFFFDAGNAWDKGQTMRVGDLRTAAGIGIRWLSPMGPFRLEWGYNLHPENDERHSDWGFTIGNFF